MKQFAQHLALCIVFSATKSSYIGKTAIMVFCPLFKTRLNRVILKRT